MSTDVSRVRKYGDALYIADSHDDFIARVRALLDKTAAHDPAPGFAAAEAASWQRTVPDLAGRLERTLA